MVLFVCFYGVPKLGDFGLLSTVGTIKDYKDFSGLAKHHEKAINILWPGKECCGFNRKCLLWTLLFELSVSSLRQCLGREGMEEVEPCRMKGITGESFELNLTQVLWP